MDRNKKILIVFLVIIWGGIIAYNAGFFKGTPGGMPISERAGGGAIAPLKALEDIPELRLDLLDAPRPPYKGIKKNIFSPLKFPVPKSPKKESPQELIPEADAEPVVKPPPPPSPLETFRSSVRFMGFLEKDKDRTVFLTRGDDVFLVKRGDIIEGRFRVAEITDTLLRFSDEVSGETASIVLEPE